MNNIGSPKKPPAKTEKATDQPKPIHAKIGVITKIFSAIKLFFVRLGLLFKYRDWYSEAKVKHLVAKLEEGHVADGKIATYDAQTIKVRAVLKTLSHYTQLGKAEADFLEVSKSKKPNIDDQLDNSGVEDKKPDEGTNRLETDNLPTFRLLEKMTTAAPRLLFQIQADEFGANNEALEGFNQKETLTYLSEYFTNRKLERLDLYGLPDSILEEISIAGDIAKAKDLDSFIALTQKAIKDSFNRNLLLPGGWAGSPGHAINYEVIPETDGTVTFRLFNLGAGALSTIDPSDYKSKAAPYIDFIGITREKISDKNVLRAIYELNTHAMLPDFKTKTEFNVSDVYQGLKNLLNPKSVEQATITQMKTTQRSGICSWRSLMAFLSSRMPREQYKRFACDIKMQSLIHRKWNMLDKSDAINLLQRSVENIARKVDKLFKENVIGKQYLLRAEELLRIAENNLKQHKINVNQSVLAHPQNSESWEPTSIQKKFIVSKPLPLHKHAHTLEFHQANVSSLNADLVHLIRGYPLEKAISESRMAIAQRNFQTAHMAMQDYIMNLAIIPQNHNKESFEKLSKELGEIAKLYFDTCFLVPEAHIIHPERIRTLELILTMQTEVAKNLNPKVAEFIFYLNKNSIFFNPNNSTVGFNNSKGTNFILNPHFGESAKFTESSYVPFTQEYPHAEMQDLLPQTYKELIESEENFADLDMCEQMAKLYVSNKTPPWYQNLRNTSLFLHYLLHQPVANPTDGVTSFNPQLNVVKKGKNFLQVFISLREVSGDILITYPELAKNRGKFQFAPVYRPFNSPAMAGFIEYITSTKSSFFNGDPKEILQTTAKEKKINFSDEHFKELAHIFVNENKVSEGFEYFYRHPEKLVDPDYQTLFEIMMFNGDYNLKNELNNDQFGLRINQYLEDQLKHSLAENEIQKASFLIRMSRIMHKYHTNVKDQTESLQMLLKQGLNHAEKSAVYAELVAAFRTKDDLKKNELEDLIVGSSYLQEHPVPDRWTIPQQNKEVREAIIIHHKKIIEVLSGEQKNPILNRISREIYEEPKGHDWEIVNSGITPWFKSADGEMSYYPTTSKIFSKKHSVALPLEIIQHPHFVQNFSKISSAIHATNNIYSFEHNGNPTLVSLAGDLVIEQKRNHIWYRFVPKEAFIIPPPSPTDKRKTQLGSRHLLEAYSHWQIIDNPKTIVLVNLKNSEIELKATLENDQITQVEKLSSAQILKKPSQLLARFEDDTYIQEWAKDNKTIDIELPRFGLTFRRHASKQNRWNCEQFKKEGFYIAAEQSIPLLGTYSNYLVLENDAGKKKILVPEYALRAPKKINAITPDFILDKYLEPEENPVRSYIAFDVKEDGFLENRSIGSKYYLSLLLTTVQEYPAAARYLRKYGQKLTPYSEKEKNALQNIANMEKITGDTSGNGLALQTYAACLLLRNSLEHDIDVPEKNLMNNIQTYKGYLAHLSNATALKLTPEEELFLLKYFLSKHFDSTLYLRLQKLDPEFAKTLTLPPEKLINANFQTVSLRSLKIPKLVFGEYMKIPVLEKMVMTRFNNYIIINPFMIFRYVQNATEEQKKWLRTAFTFNKTAPGGLWSFVFEDIFKNPSHYKSPPANTGSDYQKIVEGWWEEVINIAEKNTAEERKAFSNPQILPKPRITPKLSSNELEQIPKITFNVEIQQMPGLNASCEPLFKKSEVIEQGRQRHSVWLENEGVNPASHEPLYANEINRLKKDMDYLQVDIRYSLTDSNKLKSVLFKDREANQKQIKELENELIKLANRPSESDFDRVVERIRLKGKIRRILTLDDLMISFAKKDPESLVRMNPNLIPIIDEIYNKLGAYLSLSTFEQQRNRALQTFEKLEKSEGIERKDYEHLLGLDLLPSRSYNLNENPAYLVFEYYADILMRKTQVDKIQNFLEGGGSDQVLEMIMGSGKSKVLLPLLGLLRADGINLSMVMVPQSLFESISSDTQRILADAFSQSLKSLHFHRNTHFDRVTLQRIKDDLQEVSRRKECLIVTSKSVQCLLLKFVEESHRQKGVMTKELTLMRDILNIISKSHPIIDEVDTVLNVLHEVCFSTGKQVKPNNAEIALIADMYEILYTDAEIQKLVCIESDPKSNQLADELTEKNYHKHLKRLLAGKCLEKIFYFIKGNDRNLAIDYLCHENVAEAQIFFQNQSPRLQNRLALASEQITNFLLHTLTRTCDEKYGLDLKNGGNIAIPYAAANTPSTGSQFANPYVTMNYTFQYYIKKGISKETLMKEIEGLQAKVMQEIKEGGSRAIIQNTAGWRLFKLMTEELDIPLFNFNQKHFEQLMNKINESIHQKKRFIETFILPQLVLYEKKLSCNPQNLIAFFEHASGFTGTLWNQHSMHSKLIAKPDPGIDSKTLNLLWQKSKDEVYVINETSPIEILKELSGKGIQYNLISDSGGYLKEGGNTEVARQLSGFIGMPVVFYNKDNQQAIIENGKEVLLAESSVPTDKRCTFLDQSHTTGSDVAQKRDAIGLVTISRNMLLRDLLQSVWRLRGLDKSQSVKFVISKEVQGIICQTLSKRKDSPILFEDILRFTIINQTKQQGVDNFKGLMQEMSSLSQQIIFKVMLSPDYTEDQRKVTISELEKYWIKNSNQEPKDLFGELAVEENSQVVVKGELNKFKGKIDELRQKLPFFASDFDEMENKVNALAVSLKDLLPAQILSPIREIDDDQTVEVQQESQQETQTQLEVNESQEAEKVELGSIIESFLKEMNTLHDNIFSDTDLPYFSLKVYFDFIPEFSDYSDAFSDVMVTLNVLQWSKKNPKIKDLKLFGPHRTPFHQIEFREGKSIIKSKIEQSSYQNPSMYNLGFGFYNLKRTLTPEQRLQIVKIKFLNGESNYSKDDATILETWLKANGSQKMLKLFRDHILAGMPDKTAVYNSDSTLLKIFSRLETK